MDSEDKEGIDAMAVVINTAIHNHAARHLWNATYVHVFMNGMDPDEAKEAADTAIAYMDQAFPNGGR